MVLILYNCFWKGRHPKLPVLCFQFGDCPVFYPYFLVVNFCRGTQCWLQSTITMLKRALLLTLFYFYISRRQLNKQLTFAKFCRPGSYTQFPRKLTYSELFCWGGEGGANPVKSVEIVEVGTGEGIGVISVKSTDSKD